MGKKVKVVLKQPLTEAVLASGGNPSSADEGTTSSLARPKGGPVKPAELKHFDGIVSRAENQLVTVELDSGEQVTFPFDQVSRAHLKFEW